MDQNDQDGNRVVNPILYGQNLGQQYIVDQFAKIEFARLQYIEHHQNNLWAETYVGAKDTMKLNKFSLEGVAKRVILP